MNFSSLTSGAVSRISSVRMVKHPFAVYILLLVISLSVASYTTVQNLRLSNSVGILTEVLDQTHIRYAELLSERETQLYVLRDQLTQVQLDVAVMKVVAEHSLEFVNGLEKSFRKARGQYSKRAANYMDQVCQHDTDNLSNFVATKLYK